MEKVEAEDAPFPVVLTIFGSCCWSANLTARFAQRRREQKSERRGGARHGQNRQLSLVVSRSSATVGVFRYLPMGYVSRWFDRLLAWLFSFIDIDRHW